MRLLPLMLRVVSLLTLRVMMKSLKRYIQISIYIYIYIYPNIPLHIYINIYITLRFPVKVPALLVMGSIKDDGLGMVVWWDRQQEEAAEVCVERH